MPIAQLIEHEAALKSENVSSTLVSSLRTLSCATAYRIRHAML